MAIRSEKNKKAIRQFTRGQKQIYDEWRNRKAEAMTPQTFAREMAALEAGFRNLCSAAGQVRKDAE